MTVITASPETAVSRTISKAKLTKTTCVEVDFEQSVTIVIDDKEVVISGECPYKGRNFAHQDLIDAFKLLHPHFSLLCDLREVSEMTLHEIESELDKIGNIGVRSFTIGGTGDNEGVTLSGFKTLPGGNMLNFNTAFTKYEEQNEPYAYIVELKHVIEHICHEVELYLDGKVAPDAQLDMFGGDDDNDDDQE